MELEVVIAYLALCAVVGFVGRNRLIGFWGFFVCGLIFTPFLSLLFLHLAVPRKA